MRRLCENCYFYDCCDARRVCSNYSPIVDDLAERNLDMYIEAEREEYWNYFYGVMEEEDRLQDYFG